MSETKPERREVRLDDKLHARLMEQARAEQAARFRVRAFKRYVLLPAVLLTCVISVQWTFYGDSTESVIGNLLGSSVIWFCWKVRHRLPQVFGFA